MTEIYRQNSLSVAPEGVAYLLGELASLGRSSRRDHERRVGRSAITFRPSRRGRDGLPDEPVSLDGFKLLAIQYGWTPCHQGRRPAINLGIYRARFEGSSPTPIRFRLEERHDLIRPRSLTGSRNNLSAIRSAVLLHQAVQDGERANFNLTLNWPRFFYGYEPGRLPEFSTMIPFVTPDSMRLIDGLHCWPAELFKSPGARVLESIPPRRVFASLAHLKGREIRNPAYGVLVKHGLLPRHQVYRTWRMTVSNSRNGVRQIQNAKSEGTEAGRLRRLIESHVLADTARESALLADLESACLASGMKLPEGLDRTDRLAELLDNPWTPAWIPYASSIQRLTSDLRTLRGFGDGSVSLDLEELMPGERG